MSNEEETINWHKIPLRLEAVDFTTSQEQTVREYARSQGYKDLRGFHMHMRSEELNYYDVIRVYYEE